MKGRDAANSEVNISRQTKRRKRIKQRPEGTVRANQKH